MFVRNFSDLHNKLIFLLYLQIKFNRINLIPPRPIELANSRSTYGTIQSCYNDMVDSIFKVDWSRANCFHRKVAALVDHKSRDERKLLLMFVLLCHSFSGKEFFFV